MMLTDEHNEYEDNSPEEAAATPDEVAPTPPVAATGDPKLGRLARAVNEVRAELGKVIVGQTEFVELLIAALFAGGHVLV